MHVTNTTRAADGKFTPMSRKRQPNDRKSRRRAPPPTPASKPRHRSAVAQRRKKALRSLGGEVAGKGAQYGRPAATSWRPCLFCRQPTHQGAAHASEPGQLARIIPQPTPPKRHEQSRKAQSSLRLNRTPSGAHSPTGLVTIHPYYSVFNKCPHTSTNFRQFAATARYTGKHVSIQSCSWAPESGTYSTTPLIFHHLAQHRLARYITRSGCVPQRV